MSPPFYRRPRGLSRLPPLATIAYAATAAAAAASVAVVLQVSSVTSNRLRRCRLGVAYGARSGGHAAGAVRRQEAPPFAAARAVLSVFSAALREEEDE